MFFGQIFESFICFHSQDFLSFMWEKLNDVKDHWTWQLDLVCVGVPPTYLKFVSGSFPVELFIHVQLMIKSFNLMKSYKPLHKIISVYVCVYVGDAYL